MSCRHVTIIFLTGVALTAANAPGMPALHLMEVGVLFISRVASECSDKTSLARILF